MRDLNRVVLLSVLLLAPALAEKESAVAGGIVTNCTETALYTAMIGGGHVLLSCDSTITLSQTIVVAKDMTLDGTGHSAGLAGSAFAASGRLFQVRPGVRLTVRNLTLSGGIVAATNIIGHADGEAAFGAAIYNEGGVVTLDGCTLSNHQVTGGAAHETENGDGGNGGSGLGAAIYNLGGQLIVTNTTFSGNSAQGGAATAGGTVASGGRRGQGGNGGNGGAGAGAAIYNAGNGVVSVSDSLFSSNRVASSTGGTAGAGSGGLQFPGNAGAPGIASGAAVFNESGRMTLVNCTFSGNRAAGAAGTAGLAGTSLISAEKGTSGGPALGAGAYNVGLLWLTNCTFVQNSVAGGTGGTGGTGGEGILFGQDGANGGQGGAALGAGVLSGGSGTSWLVNCTFSDNAVRGGAGGRGGAGSGIGKTGKTGATGDQSGGAVYSSATLVLRNSILAYSPYGGNAGGTIADGGYNLSSDITPVFTAAGSQNRVDPLLESFTMAGGLVPTLTLSSNSPAINAIKTPGGNGAPLFDQRNAYRVEPFDIGAYEYDGVLPTPPLAVQIVNEQVVLSWSASGSYLLQSTPALSMTSRWTTVPQLPATSNGVNTLTVNNNGGAAFYRLRQP